MFFKPRYRIEIERDGLKRGAFCFWIWRGWSFPDLVASDYGFPTPQAAAVAARETRENLLEAWRMTR